MVPALRCTGLRDRQCARGWAYRIPVQALRGGARPGGIRGRWGRLIFTGKLIPCQIPRDSGLSVARETSALKTKDLPRVVAKIAVRPLVVGHPTGSCTGRSRSLWPRSGAGAYLHDQWSYSRPKRNDNWSRGIHGFVGENRWGRPSGVRQRQCVVSPLACGARLLRKRNVKRHGDIHKALAKL